MSIQLDPTLRKIQLEGIPPDEASQFLRREWLLTNGLGGYASGTIAGHVERRYHGVLIAALPAPFGRVVMLNHLAEFICMPDGSRIQISGEAPTYMEDGESSSPHALLLEFRLEHQLPIWKYRIGEIEIEKRMLLVNRQNTVHVSYSLTSGPESISLELRPSIHYRPHEGDVGAPISQDYLLTIRGRHYEIAGGVHDNVPYPPLRMLVVGEQSSFTHEGGSVREITYQNEADRGYHSRGILWNPGYFRVDVHAREAATLIASTEEWPTILALSPEEALRSDGERRLRLLAQAPVCVQTGPGAELVLAADQFIMAPAGRLEDIARARAAGDEVRSVIAGYHWFTDWGRDTMISLEGLTLSTGRHTEAGWIIRTFAHYVRAGLIPNYFPDGQNEGVYHTADATLWFFHAIDRYLDTTGDLETLRILLPKLQDIIDHHIRGTRFGIGVDPKDGLLRQGAEGYQLTWMDAKVDGWVVTPRRGKAVEINALWYNALRLMERWSHEMGDEDAAALAGTQAAQCRASFNLHFWNEQTGYLYDVIDGENGNDPACRPNQLFTFTLPHPVLEEKYWEPVLEVVRAKLLTPVGLRSLSPDHPDYKSRYFGDLRARDAAYHQGTVWGWLIGPFIDAWLKVHPGDKKGARCWLEAALPHLDEACIGQISEVFDGEAPFTARGCIAQAWSVAETLRCWVKTAPDAEAADQENFRTESSDTASERAKTATIS